VVAQAGTPESVHPTRNGNIEDGRNLKRVLPPEVSRGNNRETREERTIADQNPDGADPSSPNATGLEVAENGVFRKTKRLFAPPSWKYRDLSAHGNLWAGKGKIHRYGVCPFSRFSRPTEPAKIPHKPILLIEELPNTGCFETMFVTPRRGTSPEDHPFGPFPGPRIAEYGSSANPWTGSRRGKPIPLVLAPNPTRGRGERASVGAHLPEIGTNIHPQEPQ